MPHITSSNRISPRSKTFTNNIFSTDLSDNQIAGNIVTSISDHLAQFLILPNRKLQKVTKTVIYQRNFTKMDKKCFPNDLRNLNWETTLSIAKKEANHSFRKFCNITETLLDTYAPLSPLSKADQKRKLKPWITKGLLTSIKKKNKIYKKFCRAKNDQNKHTLHEEFKIYQNTILKLTKINKSKHYQTFFVNIRKTLKKHGRELNQLLIID